MPVGHCVWWKKARLKHHKWLQQRLLIKMLWIFLSAPSDLVVDRLDDTRYATPSSPLGPRHFLDLALTPWEGSSKNEMRQSKNGHFVRAVVLLQVLDAT
jgi:hypothetical protein